MIRFWWSMLYYTVVCMLYSMLFSIFLKCIVVHYTQMYNVSEELRLDFLSAICPRQQVMLSIVYLSIKHRAAPSKVKSYCNTEKL